MMTQKEENAPETDPSSSQKDSPSQILPLLQALYPRCSRYREKCITKIHLDSKEPA